MRSSGEEIRTMFWRGRKRVDSFVTCDRKLKGRGKLQGNDRLGRSRMPGGGIEIFRVCCASHMLGFFFGWSLLCYWLLACLPFRDTTFACYRTNFHQRGRFVYLSGSGWQKCFVVVVISYSFLQIQPLGSRYWSGRCRWVVGWSALCVLAK